MTFSMKPYYLNQLLKHHGRALPSIQDINASHWAVKGLLRDLTHHIPHVCGTWHKSLTHSGCV
jgi:hypothetical protein